MRVYAAFMDLTPQVADVRRYYGWKYFYIYFHRSVKINVGMMPTAGGGWRGPGGMGPGGVGAGLWMKKIPGSAACEPLAPTRRGREGVLKALSDSARLSLTLENVVGSPFCCPVGRLLLF